MKGKKINRSAVLERFLDQVLGRNNTQPNSDPSGKNPYDEKGDASEEQIKPDQIIEAKK
jgi:hypothetical protein